MARPKKKDKLIAFTVMLQQNDIDEIQSIAERAEMSAGKLARNCLKTGLEDARILDGIGAARMIGGSKRTIEKILKSFRNDSQDIEIENS